MYYNLAMMTITAFVMITFIMQVAAQEFLSKRQRGLLLHVAIITTLASGTEYLGFVISAKYIFIATIIEFCATPCIAYLFIKAICENLKPIINKLFQFIIVVNSVLIITSNWTRFIFYYDESYCYQRGKFYLIYISINILCIIISLVAMCDFGKENQTDNMDIIALIASFLFVCCIFQVFIDINVVIIKLCISISIVQTHMYYTSVIQRTDRLTKLLNQSSWRNIVDNNKHYKEKCYVLICDIKKFKEINDQNGHSYGDKCLRIVGETIKEVCLKYGKCYRIGGDEFGIIITKKVSEEDIKSLKKLLNNRIKEKMEYEKSIPMLNVGYEEFDPNLSNITLKEVIKIADKKMYNDKNNKS